MPNFQAAVLHAEASIHPQFDAQALGTTYQLVTILNQSSIMPRIRILDVESNYSREEGMHNNLPVAFPRLLH